MRNPHPVLLEDVLLERRRQMPVRLLSAVLLAVPACLLVGWMRAFGLFGGYVVLQLAEARFTGAAPLQPGVQRGTPRRALGLLFASSATFGAAALLLARSFGDWGGVYGAYMLCGGILSSVLSTIGCREAFRASASPYFVYLFLLPFEIHERSPSVLFTVTALLGTLYLIAIIRQFWAAWSRMKEEQINAVLRDIEMREASERRLYLLSQRDGLTGLLSREVLHHRLGQNARGGAPGALLLVDLDGFKYVNDTLGHSAGDVVLCEIAARIQRSAGPQDTAARLGGDEFALLLPQKSDEAEIVAIAERLIREVSRPVLLDGQPINIGASIGIVLHPQHGEEAEALFLNADLALYQAKGEGRNCARLYHPCLRAIAQGKVRRDTELGLALERGEFEVFYQPKVSLPGGRLTGAEALLRWRHPQDGLLTPERFIRALDGGVHAARVGDWVIETACRQAARWRAQGAPEFRIAVNLFGTQVRAGNLTGWIEEVCARSALPEAALEIEITENVFLQHEDSMIAPLTELRQRGVGIAFDDFGTGFASLSMLTRFPVTRLKIDQRFTAGLDCHVSDTAIVQAIIRLAHALDVAVTAEGIETAAQADRLAAEGCDEGQGYYFGRPMSAEAFSDYFALGQEASAARVATADD